MTINAKFVHTNLVARDWQRLARFYEKVFGCVPLLPERNHKGQWLADCTGIPNVEIRGIHLRLPGYGDAGPTLEVFQYNPQGEQSKTTANRPGFAHIAFAVDDVETARNLVLAEGGGTLGQIVTTEIPGAGKITLVYLTDPEGNIIELQSWSVKSG